VEKKKKKRLYIYTRKFLRCHDVIVKYIVLNFVLREIYFVRWRYTIFI